MKIGLIAPPWVPVPPIGYGGTEEVVDTLARGLTAAGADVVLFATGDSTCPVPRRWVYDHPQLPIGVDVAEARHLVGAYQALTDCDVIHDHTLLGPFFAGGAPVVTTNHAPFSAELRAIYGAIADRVPIIAISRSQRAEAPELPIAAVIHHGIDAEFFPVGRGDGDYLLFLGRMAPEKGAHRAIAVAHQTGRRLVIAAKMREPAEHRYFADYVQPHLGKQITHVGEVAPDEKVELLGAARALLDPITWPEPFGLVMVEALACGTPVLAFPNGAAPEIVEDGRTGFLCRDTDDMAVAVGRLDSLERANCRAAVESRFSSHRMVRDHLHLYHAILERRSLGAGFRVPGAPHREEPGKGPASRRTAGVGRAAHPSPVRPSDHGAGADRG